jgi:hypothetical protein
MAFAYTFILPATISGSHTDYPVVLKAADFPAAAINGTADAINNGGGNLVAWASDAKSTRLPVDVVSFVSGGSPSAEVWVKVGTAAVGETIYIEADDVQTSQPASTDTYGSEAVWTGAESVVLMEDATPVDHTGNHTLGLSGTLTNISGPFGRANSFSGNDRLSNSDSSLKDILLSYDTTISTISRDTAYRSDVAVLSFEGTDDFILYPFDSKNGDGLRVFWRDVGGSIMDPGGDALANTWVHNSFTTRASDDHEGYTNGVSVDTSTNTGTAGPFTAFYIGGFGPSSQDFDADIAQVIVWKTAKTSNWIATSEDNQSASSAWGTVGTWADAGGGSSDATGNITLPSLTLSGAALVAYLASGAATLPSLTVSGTAAAVNPAPTSGQIDLPSLTISGTAAVANPAITSGQIDLPSLTASGFALLTQDASGVFSLPSLSVTGSSDTAYLSAGGVTLPSLTTTGVAAAAVLGQATGNIILPQLTLSGAGLIALNASGSLTLPQILLAGEASGPVLGGGAIRVINSTDLAEYVNASVSYQEGIIAVDDVGTDLHPSNGIYYVSNQRIAVSFEASVFRIAGGIPFTSTGRIAMSTSAVSYYANNLPFTANGQIAVNQVSNVIRCSDIVSCTDIIPCGG